MTHNKLGNQILSLLMALVMVVSMLPMSSFTAFAADATVTDTATDTTYPYAVVDTAAGTVTIDGTLGGNATATEDDITALVDAIKGYVDSGITTIIVTGSEPALYNFWSVDTPAVSVAIFRLTEDSESSVGSGDPDSPYCGKIDLILQDVTEIVEMEFNNSFALNSITLPKVTKLGAQAFALCNYLQTITFGSVVTEGIENGEQVFNSVGSKVDGGLCNLVLSCGQVNAATEYQPNAINWTWWKTEWNSITQAHTNSYQDLGNGTHSTVCSVCGGTGTEDHSGGEATCTTLAICSGCGVSYGEVDSDNHTAEPAYTVNEFDSTQHDAYYSCCGATVTEGHSFDSTTGKCVCGIYKLVLGTIQAADWVECNGGELATDVPAAAETSAAGYSLRSASVSANDLPEGTSITVTNTTRQAAGLGNCTATYTLTDGVWTSEDYILISTGDSIEAGYGSETLPTDQSGGVSGADRMTASGTVTAGTALDLTFSHQLTKVTVRIATWNSEFANAEKYLSEVSIYTKGDTAITAYEEGYGIYKSFTAILPVGSYTADQTFMTLVVDGTELTVLVGANYELTAGLEAGYHYTFNLTVGQDLLKISKVTVEDWFPETKTTCATVDSSDNGEFNATTFEDNYANVALDSGTSIGVTVTNESDSAYNASNVKYTSEDGVWTLEGTAYGTSKSESSITAYYPYSESGSIEYDLATGGELLYGTATASDSSASLNLDRKLAKLQVEISGLPEGVTVQKMELSGIYTAATFDGSTGTLTPTGDKGAIGLDLWGETLLIPMTEEEVTLRILLSNNIVYTTTMKLAPEAGTVYWLTVNLGHTGTLTYADNGDGTHTATWSCCGETFTEDHSGEDDGDCTTAVTCTLCGSTITEAQTHSYANGSCINILNGGTICGTACEHENGSLGTYAPTEDGTQHTAIWSCCSKVETATHSGGTATCQKQAVCEICGTSYGELNSNNHEYVNGVCPCGAIAPIEKNANGIYEIYVPGQLVEFAQIVNGTHATIPQDKAANAILKADIDMTGIDWTPICSTGLYYNNSYASGYGDNDTGYAGTFDGNGHVIKNLSVTAIANETWTYGLFGTMTGTVKNLGIEGFTYNHNGASDMRTGAIVGQNLGGTIENCYVVKATITPGTNVAGGITGCNYAGTIKNCYVADSNIVASSARYGYIAGDNRADTAGDRVGTINNCYTDGGLLVGSYTGTETGCVANIPDRIFASGRITYQLNGGSSDGLWKLNASGMPGFTGDTVYQNTCGGDIFYSTTDGDFDSHNIGSDYLCTNCGSYEPATLVTAENYSDLGLDSSYVGYYAIKNASNLYWYSERERIGDISGSIVLLNDITLDNSKAEWIPIVWDGDCTFDGCGNTITLKLDYGTEQDSASYGLFGTCNYCVVKDLFLDGYLTVNTTGNVGAVAASMYRTTISGVISTVNVTNTCATGGNVGGLAGYFGGKHDTTNNQYSKIENSAVYADVTGYVAGGLIGQSWNGTQYYDITNAAYVGNIAATDAVNGMAGTIVGYQATDSNTCTFTNIYWCEDDGLDFYGKRDTANQVYTNTSAKTADQFASGEVTWLLNGESPDGIWKQTIGAHDVPGFEGYSVYLLEDGSYTNRMPGAVAEVGYSQYTTVQEAVDNANGGFVKLLAESYESVTAEGDLYLDLNGFDLKELTVSGTLYGMDSATDDYDCADGYGTIGTVNGTYAAQHRADITGAIRRYVAIEEDGLVSFHRIYAAVTHMNLKPVSAGFGYKGGFYGDQLVQKYLTAYGFNVWVTEDKVQTLTCTAEEFVTGADGNIKTLRIENVLSGAATDATAVQTEVYASVFVTLTVNGQVIQLETDPVNGTLKELLEKVNANTGAYTNEQLTALKAMVETYAAALAKAGCEIDNLK